MTPTAKNLASPLEGEEPPLRLRGIIFDLDGVLADTEPLHFRAYHDVLQELGYQLKSEDHAQHWVRDGGSIFSFIRDRGLPFDPALIKRRKDDLFLALVRSNNIEIVGCRDALLTLSTYYKISVCTSSSRLAAWAVLRKIRATALFNVVVTSNDVERRKPTPDSYLLAARSLSLRPTECIVVEDAKKGVLAALAAGIPCVTIGTITGTSVSLPSVHSIAKVTRSFLEQAYLSQIRRGTA